MTSILRSLVDAADVLKHVRNPGEGLKALLPGSLLERKVLNDGDTPTSDDNATRVAVALRELCNELKVQAINDAGEVDYRGLADSETYARMQRAAAELRKADLTALVTDAQRIAFFVNVYNVLAIHGVVALGIRKSVMEVPTFFTVVSYRIGEHVLSLDEIENGILRCNAPHPATGLRLFKESDPRLGLRPSAVDPRIHAALVCASTSCPPVAFYTAEALDAQLNAAADNYVTADVEIDDEKGHIKLPITFRYYKQDFGGTPGFPAFLLAHSTAAQHDALERAFSAGYRYEYRRYDWSLNAVA